MQGKENSVWEEAEEQEGREAPAADIEEQEARWAVREEAPAVRHQDHTEGQECRLLQGQDHMEGRECRLRLLRDQEARGTGDLIMAADV